ncbi:MAG TPA: hypothetical protein DIW47_02530 [Bacteroidetes bacterium]|nr:hypothetical protein [Bacteroidota bacterium]
MNKLALLLGFFLITGTASLAQDPDFSAEDYNVLGTVPEITLDSNEVKQDLIYIFDRIFVEYIVDSDREQYFRWHVVHNLKYINDDNAIEEHNKMYVPLYYEKSIENLVVRVYKDGKLISESLADELKTVELEETEIKLLALKGVEKGCMIETLVIKKLPLDLYDFEYFQDEAPRRSAEFALYVPKYLRFRVRSYNGMKEAKAESGFNRRMYALKQENIPGLLDEKYTFTTSNRMRVHYTMHENTNSGYTFPRYNEMAEQFVDGIMEDFGKGKKAVKTLTKNAKVTPEDDEMLKVYKIEQYLKTNIVGIPGLKQADKLTVLFKQHYGATRDVLRLYMYSFQVLDIDYEVVLTSDRSKRHFDPDFDSWNYLTDVLFYFPGSKKYLDPFANYTRLGQINDNFLGQEGLFCRVFTMTDGFGTSSKIKMIEKNPPAESHDIHNINVKFTPDLQKTVIDYNRSMNSYADLTLRFAYYSQDAEDANELIESFVKGEAEESEIEMGDIKNIDYNDPESLSHPFEINAKLTSAYYVESAGDKILLKVGELIGAQTEMYSEEPRQQPIEIEHTHKYVRNITIEIPEGYQAKGLEKLNIDLQYKNLAGEYSMGFVSSYKVEGNNIIISCEEYYYDLSYPIIQYDDFARVINAAADFNKISVLIEKK